MSQLQLFDPTKCKEHGLAMADLFYKKIQPGYRMRDEAERLVVGGLSEALLLVGDNSSHSDFLHLKGAIQKMGRSVDESISLIPAYRYSTDPKTSGTVAHLPSLTQIQGFINQLSLGSSYNGEDNPLIVTPNKAAGAIDFSDLSSGAALTPNVSGQLGEDSVEVVLQRLGIEYTSQFPSSFIGWGKKEATRPDFKISPFNVEPLERGFYLEVKWRNRYKGHDDALVALMHNIESWYDLPALVIYDGVGAIKRTYDMVCHQMEQKKRKLNGKLLALMTFSEFVLFAQTQLGDQRRAK